MTEQPTTPTTTPLNVGGAHRANQERATNPDTTVKVSRDTRYPKPVNIIIQINAADAGQALAALEQNTATALRMLAALENPTRSSPIAHVDPYMNPGHIAQVAAGKIFDPRSA